MNYVAGTSGADFLAGLLKEMNEIHGLQDNDLVLGGEFADRLTGDDGDDFVWGNGGSDTIEGGNGYDMLFGGEGDDVVTGGAENDYISGGKDADTIDAGEGDDYVDGNSGNDDIDGNDGSDYIFGRAGMDTLDGGNGDDYLDGGSDDDTLRASIGNDTYVGGSGFDTLDFSRIKAHVEIDLSKNVASFTHSGVDYFSNLDSIERVVAGDQGMRATGDSGDNVFVGAAGDDWMRGKGGADVFTGGAGTDTFVWLKKDVTDGMGIDHITDFQVGEDTMQLTDFAKGGKDYGDVIRLQQTDAGVLVEGMTGGAWTGIAMLDGLDMKSVGADHHQMSLADLGLLA